MQKPQNPSFGGMAFGCQLEQHLRAKTAGFAFVRTSSDMRTDALWPQGKVKELFKRASTAVTTLCKLSSILSWHTPLMAQGRWTIMQDLAGHKLSA